MTDLLDDKFAAALENLESWWGSLRQGCVVMKILSTTLDDKEATLPPMTDADDKASTQVATNAETEEKD